MRKERHVGRTQNKAARLMVARKQRQTEEYQGKIHVYSESGRFRSIGGSTTCSYSSGGSQEADLICGQEAERDEHQQLAGFLLYSDTFIQSRFSLLRNSFTHMPRDLSQVILESVKLTVSISHVYALFYLFFCLCTFKVASLLVYCESCWSK